MLRFQSMLAALVLLVSTACGSSPRPLTGPSSVPATTLSFERAEGPVLDGGGAQAVWNPPLNLALSGQSNADRIRQFLETRATVVGYAAASTAIAPCWSDVEPVAKDAQGNAPNDGICWHQLRPFLTPNLDAFVWWHGDADDIGSPYGVRMADLFRRVREAAKNPRLPIVILQLGPVNSEAPDSPSGQARAWAQSDPDAIWMETRDIGYDVDRQHMTPEGYRAVAERIVAVVKLKTGR